MQHVTAIGCSSQYTDSMMRRRRQQQQQPLRNRRTNHSNHNNQDEEEEAKQDRLALLAYCLDDDETTWWISEDGLDEGPQYVDFSCVSIPLSPPLSLSSSSFSSSNNNSIHTATTSTSTSVVRIQSVSIKIPPLPYGPMSLREFVLQQPKHRNISNSNSTSTTTGSNNIANVNGMDTTNNTDENAWETISPTWTLHGYTSGYQTFTFPVPGVDVSQIRLLCLSNQISADDYDRPMQQQQQQLPRLGIPQSVGFYSIRFD
jgi:hypothetical protein